MYQKRTGDLSSAKRRLGRFSRRHLEHWLQVKGHYITIAGPELQ